MSFYCRWVEHLSECSMALSTTLHYLKNVQQFMIYFSETPPESSRASKKKITDVKRELKASIKSWARPLAIHSIKVRTEKEATLPSVDELCECRRLSTLAIPKLLGNL